jgi:hypothetical protein
VLIVLGAVGNLFFIAPNEKGLAKAGILTTKV